MRETPPGLMMIEHDCAAICCQNSEESDGIQPRQRGRVTESHLVMTFKQEGSPVRTGNILEKIPLGDAIGKALAKFLHGLGDKRAELQRSVELGSRNLAQTRLRSFVP